MKRLLIYITTLCFLNSCLSSNENKVLDISTVDFSSKINTNAGIILDVTNSWDIVFYVVAGITFFGGIFYLIFASTDKQFD